MGMPRSKSRGTTKNFGFLGVLVSYLAGDTQVDRKSVIAFFVVIVVIVVIVVVNCFLKDHLIPARPDSRFDPGAQQR